jgi:hypothetical protein
MIAILRLDFFWSEGYVPPGSLPEQFKKPEGSFETTNV